MSFVCKLLESDLIYMKNSLNFSNFFHDYVTIVGLLKDKAVVMDSFKALIQLNQEWLRLFESSFTLFNQTVAKSLNFGSNRFFNFF